MVIIIGYLASIIIVMSMIFRTTSFIGTILMRSINAIGSLCFIIYGILTFTYPTAITNAAALIINIVYLLIEIKHHKEERIKVYDKMSNTSE